MADPPILDDPRLTEVGLLFEVTTGLGEILTPQITRAGLTESEFEVLLRLTRSPGGELRMSDLARQVALTSSGLTRLVDRLEGRGLLARRACPTDRRGLFAVVTPAGRDLLMGMLPEHVALIQEWFTGALSATQRAQLTDALRAVRAAVHPDADAGAAPGPPTAT